MGDYMYEAVGIYKDELIGDNFHEPVGIYKQGIISRLYLQWKLVYVFYFLCLSLCMWSNEFHELGMSLKLQFPDFEVMNGIVVDLCNVQWQNVIV
jgi:hypothetical protein